MGKGSMMRATNMIQETKRQHLNQMKENSRGQEKEKKWGEKRIKESNFKRK